MVEKGAVTSCRWFSSILRHWCRCSVGWKDLSSFSDIFFPLYFISVFPITLQTLNWNIHLHFHELNLMLSLLLFFVTWGNITLRRKEMFRTKLYLYYHCQSIHQFLQWELLGSVPVKFLQKFLFVKTEKFHGIVLAFMRFLFEVDFVVCSSYKR